MQSIPYQSAHIRAETSCALIDRWRLQRTGLRKQLLQLICSRLSSSAQYEQEARLESLRGELIDYISIGHFEVYSGLMRRQSASSEDLQLLLAYLFRCIGSSTDLVLDFNANCERSDVFVGSKEMTDALNKLTRSLLVRFALEEQMLELTITSGDGNGAQAPRI